MDKNETSTKELNLTQYSYTVWIWNVRDRRKISKHREFWVEKVWGPKKNLKDTGYYQCDKNIVSLRYGWKSIVNCR